MITVAFMRPLAHPGIARYYSLLILYNVTVSLQIVLARFLGVKNFKHLNCFLAFLIWAR